MGEGLQHVEAVASAVVEDVVAYVKAHPTYAAVVQNLGEKALQVLAAEAGL